MAWKALKRLLSFRRSKSSPGSAAPEEDSITAAARTTRIRFVDEFTATTSAYRSGVAPRCDLEPADDSNSEAGTDDETTSTTAATSNEDFARNRKKTLEMSRSDPNTEPEKFINNFKDINEIRSTYQLPTVERKVFKEPFTRNHDLMDDMLDAVLTKKSFLNMQDMSGNDRVVAQATASGVIGRDFATARALRTSRETSAGIEAGQDDATTVASKDTGIEVFDGYKKALRFFYLRFVVNAGIYDLPDYGFTVEDVDRLYTCGIIKLEDIDNVVLGSLMGHGTFRRLAHTNGWAQIDGTIAPPRGPWTVKTTSRRPTQQEIYEHIASIELARFGQRYAVNWSRLAAFERPVMSIEYIQHRLDQDGFWGLKRMAGIDDDLADRLFGQKDPTFIPLQKYPATARTPTPLEAQPTEIVLDPDEPQASPSSTVAPSETSCMPSVSRGSDSSSIRDRGRSSVPKGKKRARSRSLSTEQGDDASPRRTRQRISEPGPSSTASSDSSPSHSPSPLPTTPSKGKGKKRAQEDEDDGVPTSEASPTKKLKAVNGLAHPVPRAESSETPSSELDVEDSPPLGTSQEMSPATEGSSPPSVDSNATTARSSTSVPSESHPSIHELLKIHPRQLGMFLDQETGWLKVVTRKQRPISVTNVRVDVPPDTERGPTYALLTEGYTPTSWAQLCKRQDAPAPVPQASTVAQPEPQSGTLSQPPVTSTPAQPVRTHRPLTRQPMRYLDEVFPQFHPRYYGRRLTRRPMRYLDEVFPEYHPKFVPSGEPFV